MILCILQLIIKKKTAKRRIFMKDNKENFSAFYCKKGANRV